MRLCLGDRNEFLKGDCHDKHEYSFGEKREGERQREQANVNKINWAIEL